MSALLVFFGLLGAVLYVFLRVFRSRVQRRMEGVEMPAELLAVQRAATRPAPAVRAAVAVAPARPPAASVPHFLLIYDLAPDYLQRRAPLREEHLALAWKAADAGDLMLAGPLEEPMEQAFLVFRGSREAALRFAAADPYVKHGLVRAFRVKQWHTVVGAQASAPLRPRT